MKLAPSLPPREAAAIGISDEAGATRLDGTLGAG
jgi:hypothetical protein